MRVLDRESIKLDLHDMGFSPDTLAQYGALLKKPHGVLLLTQAPLARVKPRHFMRLCLTRFRSAKITVEDPVEYQARNQSIVHSQIGLTLRALCARY